MDDAMTAILDESNTIARDQWGRPLIIPPDGGKAIAYRRPSTLGSAIEDTSNLEKYSMRMTALGVAMRRDLLGLVAHSDPEDKKELNKICEQAKEFAGASIKANIGTGVHKLLERYDRGLDPTPLDHHDENALRAWQRFRSVTGWSVRGFEQFVVCDEIKAAGTLDRIFDDHVADIKTGDLRYGHEKFAAQLAIYARSVGYELVDGQPVRTPIGVSTYAGYILHLPAPFDEVVVYEIDLVRGWDVALVSLEVLRVRAMKQLLTGPLVFNPPPWETTRVRTEHAEPARSGSTGTEAGAEQTPPAKPKRKRAPKTVLQDAPGSTNEEPEVSAPTRASSIGNCEAELVLGRLRALSDMTRAHVLKWGREAKEAGFPIDVKTDPDERKIAVLDAMIAWAPFPDLARGAVLAVIGGDASVPTVPSVGTGVLFSLLSLEQATALIGGPA